MDLSRNHAAVMIISLNGGSTGVSLFRQHCLICSVFCRIMLIDLLWPCLSASSIICLILSSRFLFLTFAARHNWSVSLNILDRSWWIPGLPPDNPMLFSLFLFLLIPMTVCCHWPNFAPLAIPRGPSWQLMGSFRAERFMDASGSFASNSYRRSIYHLHNKNRARTLCQLGSLGGARAGP